jgi:hypothetical protein
VLERVHRKAESKNGAFEGRGPRVGRTSQNGAGHSNNKVRATRRVAR